MSKTRSAKPDTNVSFRTSIGGQALIEGILMRGPEKQAIVCRTEDGLVEKVCASSSSCCICGPCRT